MNDLIENYFYFYKRSGRTLMTPSIQLAVKRTDEEDILVHSNKELVKIVTIHSSDD